MIYRYEELKNLSYNQLPSGTAKCTCGRETTIYLIWKYQVCSICKLDYDAIMSD